MVSTSHDKVANRQLHCADAELLPALGGEYIYWRRKRICRESSSQTHLSVYIFGDEGQGEAQSNSRVKV